MGRDHSVECEKCGDMYGGFNGPDECECDVGWTNEPTIADAARTEQIARAAIAFVNATCHDDVYESGICDQCGDDCGACRVSPHSTSCPVGRAEYELRCAVTGETPESEYYR